MPQRANLRQIRRARVSTPLRRKTSSRNWGGRVGERLGGVMLSADDTNVGCPMISILAAMPLGLSGTNYTRRQQFTLYHFGTLFLSHSVRRTLLHFAQLLIVRLTSIVARIFSTLFTLFHTDRDVIDAVTALFLLLFPVRLSHFKKNVGFRWVAE